MKGQVIDVEERKLRAVIYHRTAHRGCEVPLTMLTAFVCLA